MHKFLIKENKVYNYGRKIYKKTILSNGLRIVTETVPNVHSISIGIWIKVGSRDETLQTNGISHFLEHMLFKGTKSFSAKQIATQIEGYGGYLNAWTGKEATCLYAKILDENLDKTVDILCELILYPKIITEDIEKERFVIIEEIKNIEDDPEDYIYEVYDRTLFGNNSLGYPVIGNADNVTKFKRNDLLRHLKKYYFPENIVVAAAGNVKHDELVQLISKYFERKFPEYNHSEIKRVSPKKALKRFLKEEKPIQQAHICSGTISYGIKSIYRHPLTLMNTLIGEGMSSRLFQNIREKYGFSYSIGSFLNFYSDSGSFGVYSSTDKKHVDASLELLYKELEKIKNIPVSEAELNRAKMQVKGTMLLGLENMSNRMMRLGSNEIYFDEYLTIESIMQKIDSVTQDDIQEVANKIINLEKFTSVIFIPIN